MPVAMTANVKTQLPRAPRPATAQVAPRVSLAATYHDRPANMNPWEVSAMNYRYPDQSSRGHDGRAIARNRQPATNADPIIYPGLYSSTGFDMMSILMRVAGRPNPKVQLGPIDCSVALLLCDLAQPDIPIVYASEAFASLTGYSNAEILGRNCRFLQAPGGKVRPSSHRKYVDERTVRKMHTAVQTNDEVQLEVVNFKRDGSLFVNVLTMIPVRWDSQDFRYCVGFQVERED